MADLTNPQVALMAASRSSEWQGAPSADRKILDRADQMLEWLRANDRESHTS